MSNLTEKYPMSKRDLVELVKKNQEKEFSEDVDFVERIGGRTVSSLSGYLFL